MILVDEPFCLLLSSDSSQTVNSLPPQYSSPPDSLSLNSFEDSQAQHSNTDSSSPQIESVQMPQQSKTSSQVNDCCTLWFCFLSGWVFALAFTQPNKKTKLTHEICKDRTSRKKAWWEEKFQFQEAKLRLHLLYYFHPAFKTLEAFFWFFLHRRFEPLNRPVLIVWRVLIANGLKLWHRSSRSCRAGPTPSATSLTIPSSMRFWIATRAAITWRMSSKFIEFLNEFRLIQFLIRKEL